MLKNHVFDEVRDKKNEITTFKKLILEVDQDNVYDYDNHSSMLFDTEDYLKMIIKDA